MGHPCINLSFVCQSSTMKLLNLLFLVIFCCHATSLPYFYPTARLLQPLAAPPQSNIANLRSPQFQITNLPKTTANPQPPPTPTSTDDPLDPLDIEQPQVGVAPTFVQKKLRNIVAKIRLLTGLLPFGGATSDKDDDFQREMDEFDRELKNEIEGAASANVKVKQSERLEVDPNAIGVFFMELLGSLIGIVYGAVAQTSAQTPVTTGSV